jgi:hypothetical protein
MFLFLCSCFFESNIDIKILIRGDSMLEANINYKVEWIIRHGKGPLFCPVIKNEHL